MVGSDPDHIVSRTRIPTGRPTETLAKVFAFFQHEVSVGGPLAAIGIASFGPLELRRSHPRYGFIRKTPKPGWSDVDMVGLVRSTLGVPVGFDTDVNAAALAEGRILHGLGHPEMGHLSVPRHPGDDFAGSCPFHGDCLEGMASGAAIAARWGRPAERLDGDELGAAVELEATYLAAGLRNIVYAIAPQRIVIGGSVAELPGLFPLVGAACLDALAGYPGLPEHAAEKFIVPATLGSLAGPAGGLVLADHASQPGAVPS
jgi:fructokinase